MKTVCVFVVGAGLAILAGCRHAEPSPIVTAFQNAGGGDVGHATPGSISAFLAKREDLRKQLTPLCKQRQVGARQIGQPRTRARCARAMQAPTSSESPH